ncbi:MAG TPA: hypothetical protein V6D05_00450 [Stenomitos sp.]
MATPSLDGSVQALTLGRKNPFRPLVVTSEQHLPPAPGLPAAPTAVKPPKIERPSARIAYLGLAYDGAEAVAAINLNGKVRFVRRGEEVAGAKLTSISPDKLIWKRGEHHIESPLYHRPGAPTP